MPSFRNPARPSSVGERLKSTPDPFEKSERLLGRALGHRVNDDNKDKSWKEYITELNQMITGDRLEAVTIRRDALNLRQLIVDTIKRRIGCQIVRRQRKPSNMTNTNIQGAERRHAIQTAETAQRAETAHTAQTDQTDQTTVHGVTYRFVDEFDIVDLKQSGDINNKCAELMRTFVMDSGSVNDESDADLTIVNPPEEGAHAFVSNIIDQVNLVLPSRKYLTEEDLKRLFEISFYLNTFIASVDGRIAYVHCPAARIRQRQHAKRRLDHAVRDDDRDGPDRAPETPLVSSSNGNRSQSRRASSSMRSMNSTSSMSAVSSMSIDGMYGISESGLPSLRETSFSNAAHDPSHDGSRREIVERLLSRNRNVATGKGRNSYESPCETLVDLMSQVTYFVDDAYHSQGAFLHVLLEIQSDVPLGLEAWAYLDSAFDNAGMMAETALGKEQGAVSPKTFSKYASRVAHALGAMVTNAKGFGRETLDSATRAVVKMLDDESIYAADHDGSPRDLSCSVGRLSATHRKPTKKDERFSKFEHVFDAVVSPHRLPQISNSTTRSGICPFFVPQREFVGDNTYEFLKKLRTQLQGLEALEALER